MTEAEVDPQVLLRTMPRDEVIRHYAPIFDDDHDLADAWDLKTAHENVEMHPAMASFLRERFVAGSHAAAVSTIADALDGGGATFSTFVGVLDIVVVAVAHQRRRPGFWKGRL